MDEGVSIPFKVAFDVGALCPPVDLCTLMMMSPKSPCKINVKRFASKDS